MPRISLSLTSTQSGRPAWVAEASAPWIRSCLRARRRSRWRQVERAKLYRVLETVGHWSMLDVFVVVLLVGMVRFGAFASVEPGPGLLAFGGVVVLTMLASASFDPRLIWPATDD